VPPRSPTSSPRSTRTFTEHLNPHSLTVNGDTISTRLDRIEIKAETSAASAAAASAAASSAAAAATAAANTASAAAAAAHKAAESTTAQIENLKIAVIGGGPLLPDDRGALGRLEEKFDKYAKDVEARVAAAQQTRVSRRAFVMSIITVGVMLVGAVAGFVWNFVSIHH
jgi:cobalamin biosynthesis Mg chelatase CobN